MELNEFVIKFAEQFDETEKNIFSPKTKFKELDEWSSMIALVIIAMVDSEYSLKLTGEDIRLSITVEDLYKKVLLKNN